MAEISKKLISMLGDWECLYPFFKSEEWTKIKEQLRPDMDTVTPEVDNWFKAFNLCSFRNIKVVWLGLSPYYSTDSYTGKLVADGLAFSTDPKHSVPPSLFKIYKGMEWDMWKGMNLEMNRHNDLTFLAYQGVLLLNSALTTNMGQSESHLEIWRPFILEVIKQINDKKEGIVFTGFGKVANELLTHVNKEKHIVFEREHPAASAYASRDWDHKSIFSLTNKELEKREKTKIFWDRYLGVEVKEPIKEEVE